MQHDDVLNVWLSPTMLGILGLLVGSFLNVVIYRLPIMMERQWWGDIADQLGEAQSWQRVSGTPAPFMFTEVGSKISAGLAALPPLGIAKPRSRCGACGHAVRWYENLPVVSWLALRGRCSACSARISLRYPAVEITTALLFASLAWHFGPNLQTLAWCAVAALLIAMALIDWDTTLLPDMLTQPLLWGGLIAAACEQTLPLTAAVAGAAAGYLSLWSIYWLFKLATGKEGMGAGDFKLLAALGAWLGWQALLPIALMASIGGLLVSIPMKLSGRLSRGEPMPFGPFLASGGLAVIFVGADRCLAWMGIF